MADENEEGSNNTGGGSGPPEMVSYKRLNEVVVQRDAARAELAASRAENAPLAEKAALADTLTGQLAELQAQYDNDKTGWASERSLIRSGFVDEEAQVVAKVFHSRLPAEDRPPIGDWLEGLKAEGAEVPRALAVYLNGSTTGSEKPDTGKGPAGGSGNAGAGQHKPPPANTTVSDELIAAAKLKGIKEGDWSDYEALRKSIPGVKPKGESQ